MFFGTDASSSPAAALRRELIFSSLKRQSVGLQLISR